MGLYQFTTPATRFSRSLRINRRHTLAAKLYSCALSNGVGTTVDLVDGARWTPSSASSFTARHRTRGVITQKTTGDFTRSHNRQVAIGAFGTSASAFILANDVVASVGLIGDARGGVFNGFFTDPSNQLQLRVSGADRITAWSGTVPTTGEVRIGFSTQLSDHRVYSQGVAHGTGTGAVHSWQGVNELGGYTSQGGSGAHGWHLMYSWYDRFLSDSEHEMLARDPYCLLEESYTFFTAAAAFKPSWAVAANTVIQSGARAA